MLIVCTHSPRQARKHKRESRCFWRGTEYHVTGMGVGGTVRTFDRGRVNSFADSCGRSGIPKPPLTNVPSYPRIHHQ